MSYKRTVNPLKIISNAIIILSFTKNHDILCVYTVGQENIYHIIVEVPV